MLGLLSMSSIFLQMVAATPLEYFPLGLASPLISRLPYMQANSEIQMSTKVAFHIRKKKHSAAKKKSALRARTVVNIVVGLPCCTTLYSDLERNNTRLLQGRELERGSLYMQHVVLAKATLSTWDYKRLDSTVHIPMSQDPQPP